VRGRVIDVSVSAARALGMMRSSSSAFLSNNLWLASFTAPRSRAKNASISLTKARATAGGRLSGLRVMSRHLSLILVTPSGRIAQARLLRPNVPRVWARTAPHTPPPSCGGRAAFGWVLPLGASKGFGLIERRTAIARNPPRSRGNEIAPDAGVM
jgi:hypothetical protein